MSEVAPVPASASSTPAVDPNYKPQEGRVGNLTEAQQKALDTFKEELKKEGVFVEGRMDDGMLLR